MSEVVLIHEPDVEFDVVSCNGGNGGNGDNGGNGGKNSNHGKSSLLINPVGNMHHGEIYIYLNQIFLHHRRRWYKANIDDIINIQTNVYSEHATIKQFHDPYT
jgi:hypothetical protein